MDFEGSSVDAEDLVDLPLDEVFRRMKKDGKFQAGQSTVGVSQLLRRKQSYRWIGAGYQDLCCKTSVANKKARKKAKPATAFDLRIKLIQMRLAGLDLRYKLIARMINKLKLREVASAKQFPDKVHHYGVSKRQPPIYYSGASQFTGLSDFQPRVTHNTISWIQWLVGNHNPSWMTNVGSSSLRAANPNCHSGNGTNPSRCSSAVPVPPDYYALCSKQPNYANIQAAELKHFPFRIDVDGPPPLQSTSPLARDLPPPLEFTPPLARDLPPPLERATRLARFLPPPLQHAAPLSDVAKSPATPCTPRICFNWIKIANPPRKLTLNERFQV